MQEIIFVLQKICLRLLFPVSVGLFLLCAGLFLRSRVKWSVILLIGGVVWLVLMSFPLTGLFLIGSLEKKAGPYADPAALCAKGVRYVVVLSGGFRDGELTPADRLGPAILRVMEGVRLWKGIPGSKLVLTGGVIPGINYGRPLSQAMEEMAVELGVRKEAIAKETISWTTEDQATLVKPIVGSEPFALVTSAFHLPRSMVIFRSQGLAPLAAPAEFRAKRIRLHYDTLIPNAEGLVLSQIATKEYLATWWVLLRNRFVWK
ncbi:YdcF family protein [Thermodesulfobacteriota bacterium]